MQEKYTFRGSIIPKKPYDITIICNSYFQIYNITKKRIKLFSFLGIYNSVRIICHFI